MGQPGSVLMKHRYEDRDIVWTREEAFENGVLLEML